MKKILRFISLAAVAAFVFTACEGPMGPMGPMGAMEQMNPFSNQMPRTGFPGGFDIDAMLKMLK